MAARQAFSHESLSETSTNTSGTWPTATTFTFTPDANSEYWIFFSCLFANGSGTAGHYGEASVFHDQGGVSLGYWAHRSQETSSPQDWCSVVAVHKSSFGASPGAQDYILSINSSHAGDTTKIKDIRFLAIKADAADQYAAQDASTSTASTSYTTRTTLTFTPASTGDYLLIASATLTADTASNAHGARLNHSGGSIYGENLTYPKAAWLYNTWATAAKVNLTAASKTFDLQYKTSANNAYIEQARILALRLDRFDNAYVAQDFTGGNTTSASDADFLTLTQTPLNLSHAVLGVAAFRTQSTTVSGYLNVCKGGTNYTETPREGVNTAGYVHAGVAVKETLAASSTTWKWRARAETAGTTITADDLLIAVLQLDASPSAFSGTGAITSAATLSSAGNKQGAGIGATSSAATLSSTGRKAASGTGAVAGATTLSSTGRKQGLGTGSTSSTASLDAAGDKQGLGTAAITADATPGSTGGKQAIGTGAITATATLVPTGGKQGLGTGAIAVTGSLSTTGVRHGLGTSAIAATAALSSVGNKQASGTASLDASATLSSEGTAQTDIAKAGAGAIAAGAALSSAGGKQGLGTGAIASPASLASIGGKQASGAVALSATASLFSTGGKQAIGAVAIASAATLSAQAVKQGLGTGAIAATATLSATGAPSIRVILATSELMARRILVNTLAAKRLMTTALAGKRTLISDLHGKAQP